MTRPLAEILDDMRENLLRLRELALYNHPDLCGTFEAGPFEEDEDA